MQKKFIYLIGDVTEEYNDLMETIEYLIIQKQSEEELNNENTEIDEDLQNTTPVVLADLTSGTYNWTTGTQGAITIPTGNTVTINLSGKVTMTGKITVAQDSTLTIKGSGTILRGSGYEGALLDIYDTANLIVIGNSTTDRIIIDGNYGLNQTAEATLIRCDQDLTLKNVTLQSNYTDRYRDTEDEEDLTVNSEDTYAGGALTILNHDNNVTIDNCIIKDCQAVNGGGIYFCRLGTGTINITNSTISNCISTGTKGGGGIFIDGALKTGENVNIEDIANYTINMSNVVMQNCQAPNGSAMYMHNQGSSKITMTNCTVTNCASSGSGSYGTLRCDGNSNYQLTISGGKIYNNTSSGCGGGIYWNASGIDSKLVIKENVQIYNNEAKTQGGGLFVEGKNISIYSAQIYNNKATMGGAIGIKTFADTSFKGGNWSSSDSFNLSLSEGVIVKDNIATDKGGGLSFNIVDGIPEDGFTFNYINDGAVFENNIVSSDGGTTISGVGGAIAMIQGTSTKNYNVKTTIASGTFRNNKATEGGAIHSTIGDFFMTGGTIEKHDVSGNGGGIYVSGGSFEISGTAKISDCKAANGGGLNVSGGNVKITNGTIVNCQATNGGGIYISNGDLTMNGGSIENNQATTYGGGIYASTDTQNLNLSITSGSIIGNIAEINGGGVGINIADGYSANVTVGLKACMGIDESHSHPIIKDNTANEYGGGFWLNGNNMTMNMYCGKIDGNLAIKEPGSSNLYQTGGTATVYNGSVGEGVIVIGGKYTYMPEEDITNEVKIIYNSNIPNAETTKEALVSVGVEIYLPKTLFTREDYILVGWSNVKNPTASDVIYEAGGPYNVTEQEVTVYAVWLKEGAGTVETPIINAGKIYTNISGGTNAMITSNSAITVQMNVIDILPNLYKDRKLVFYNNLDLGTTITMIDMKSSNNKEFYSYKVTNTTTKEIPLNLFVKNGSTNNYVETTGEEKINENFLFILELPMQNEVIGLNKMSLIRESADSEVASIEQVVTYTTTSKRNFNIEVSQNENLMTTDEIKIIYNNSEISGEDSHYENKKLSLVISENNQKISGETKIFDGVNYYQINSDDSFIIPLGNINENKEKNLQIISKVLNENEIDIDLNIKLIVSENFNNPGMGEIVFEEENIKLKSIALSAIKLNMQEIIYKSNESFIDIDIEYEVTEFENNNVELEIQKKTQNGYETQNNIIDSINGNSENLNGIFDVELNGDGIINVKIKNTIETGTYRILLKDKTDTKNVSCNFIIVE